MPGELPVLTVSGLSALLKDVVEGSFPTIVLQGEVSGVKLASSGHLYCDLKDENAVINAIAWRGVVARMASIPQNGDFVKVIGQLTTYPKRSSYQLQINRIDTAGLGVLLQQLELLKQRLRREGLFDQERKRELPLLPRKIGIITSSTGAVIQDMLHRIEQRCPRHVVVWPVSVQGASAASEIVSAIQGFNSLPATERPDVLIIARGGGSFEDLMPFNDEGLVRALASSAIPTISGVGHEPDVTLCDFAADVRASTPTAAAEMAVPVKSDINNLIQQYTQLMQQEMCAKLTLLQQQVDYLVRLLPNPLRQVVQYSVQVDESVERSIVCMRRIIRENVKTLEVNSRIMRLQDPKLPFKRGFVVLRDSKGGVVASAYTRAKHVSVEFVDGQRKALLEG